MTGFSLQGPARRLALATGAMVAVFVLAVVVTVWRYETAGSSYSTAITLQSDSFAVAAAEVHKLAERSLRSTESIREIIAGVQDETNVTIMATEQGTKQAREVGELMTQTASMLEESGVTREDGRRP